MLKGVLFGMMLASIVGPLLGWRGYSRLAAAGFPDAAAGAKRGTGIALVAATLLLSSVWLPEGAGLVLSSIGGGVLLLANWATLRVLDEVSGDTNPRTLYIILALMPIVIFTPLGVVLFMLTGAQIPTEDGLVPISLDLAIWTSARQSVGMTGILLGLGGLGIASFTGKVRLQQQAADTEAGTTNRRT